MVRYTNYVIFIFIFKNINANIRNERQIVEKLRGVPKDTGISAATFLRVTKLVSNQR